MTDSLYAARQLNIKNSTNPAVGSSSPSVSKLSGSPKSSQKNTKEKVKITRDGLLNYISTKTFRSTIPQNQQVDSDVIVPVAQTLERKYGPDESDIREEGLVVTLKENLNLN